MYSTERNGIFVWQTLFVIASVAAVVVVVSPARENAQQASYWKKHSSQTRGKIPNAENESDGQNKNAEWKWLSETDRIARAHDETAE